MEHGRSGTIVKHRPLCVCGETGVRDDKFDAYYCPVSNVWLEDGCKDGDCDFCPVRPEKHAIA